MQKIFGRSLRSRILLLVVLTFLFLAAAAVSLFTFLRSRHSETLSLTEHHLISVALSLAADYSTHVTAENSLRNFLERYAKRNQSAIPGLTEDAVVALQRYSFPGNVRELEHLVERAAVKAGGRAITAELIQDELTEPKTPAAGGFDLASSLRLPFHEAVASWERHLIEQALKAAHGNKADAARRLGIHRRLLYEKLGQLGLI